MPFSPLFCWCGEKYTILVCVCVCVCVCYSSYKQNTEEKHTLISRCRKSIWQNFTWIHDLKKKTSSETCGSCPELRRSLVLTVSTKKGQTDFKPTRSQGRITASTGLKPRVASCLQGEERCQPDSAPWATTSWGRIGEGLCPDWQAGGSVTGPGGYTAWRVRIFS